MNDVVTVVNGVLHDTFQQFNYTIKDISLQLSLVTTTNSEYNLNRTYIIVE